jgi:UDP-N-acetyl-2-amino-2-deoxyglucuronate dehydrogenase
MTAPKLRLALIGAGLASAPHVRSLQELTHAADVRWVVGRTETRGGAVAAQLPGARATTDIAAVLADPEVDAAIVLTPADSHLELVRALAVAGKHVLLEKPLATSLDDSVAVVEACRRAGVRLGVVLQHRFHPAARAFAESMAGGALGEMTSAAVEVRWWRPQSYYDEPGRGTRARDGGGVLMTQAIHTLDLFLTLAGVPAQVTAFAGTSAAHRMECEDIVAAALRYANGAVATVNATTAAPPGFDARIEIAGTRGSATLAAGRLELRALDGSVQTAGEAQGSGAGADPMAFPHRAHCAVIEDFIAAIAERRDPMVSGASALPVHRLIDTLLAAAAQGRVLAFE